MSWNQDVLLHELAFTHYLPQEAIDLQKKWRSILREEPHAAEKSSKSIRWISGVDISYPKMDDPDWGIACAVLWDLSENQMVTSSTTRGKIPFPYIPGLLGFRECQLLLKTLVKLPHKPDVILCDGHGLIHPRRFGEAIQLGVILQVPTIGVAKKMFIGECDLTNFNQMRGEKRPITKNNEVLGYCIHLKEIAKPVYISCGYQMSNEKAIDICLRSTIHNKQPETIFLADQLSRRAIQARINELK